MGEELDTVQNTDAAELAAGKSQDGIVEESQADPDAELVAQKEKGWNKLFTKARQEQLAMKQEFFDLIENLRAMQQGTPNQTQAPTAQGNGDEDIIEFLKKTIDSTLTAKLDEKLKPLQERFSATDRKAYVSEMSQYSNQVLGSLDKNLEDKEQNRIVKDAISDLDYAYKAKGGLGYIERLPIETQKEILQDALSNSFESYTNERNELISKYTKQKKSVPTVEGKGGSGNMPENKVRVSKLSDRERQKGFASLLRQAR